MKRILIVAADGLTKSGVPNVFVNIIRNLSSYGYSFDVLYFDDKDSFYKEEIEKYGGRVIYSPIDTKKTSKLKKLFVKLRYTKEIKNIIAKYGPYHCVHSFKGFESGYILKAAYKAGIKHRISHMTFFYNAPDNRLVRLIENHERRLVEKYSTYVVSDSERTSRNNMPTSKKRMVIRNFVDENTFSFSELESGIKGISFIQIGSYCQNKNQLFSLEIFKKIIEFYPESHLHFVGFRNPDDVSYFDTLKEEVEKYDLNQHVSFHEHDADTKSLFRRCNYLLFPSFNESFGIVVVEAQLSGLPCFCSDSISKEGNCGGCTYLPISDVNKWVKTICDEFKKDSGSHKQFDCSRFKKENIVKQYIDIYEGKIVLARDKTSTKTKKKCFLFNLKNLKMSILSFVAVFFGSVFLLVSGATNTDTKTFGSASYAAEIIKENEKVDHLALIVEQKQKGVVPDTASELRSLYGAFGNRESNYAGTINASKDKNLTFADFDLDSRVSFVYVQTGVQVSNTKDDNGVIHHRMEFYPLELMFEFYPNNPTGFYSFLYLSTSQARKVIDYRYPGLFNSELTTNDLLNNDNFVGKCKEIIGTGINIKFDETVKSFQITNIFYEKDYFYNVVHNTIGEFLVGYNQYPDGFQKQATYFLNKYEYQNKFYMSYIKERFDKNDCDFSAASIGLNANLDSNKLFKFLDDGSNIASTIFLVVSIASYLISIFVMVRFKLLSYPFLFYLLIALLTPYLLGFVLWKISKNVAFFSSYFTVSLLIVLLVISTFLICYSLILKWSAGKKKHE